MICHYFNDSNIPNRKSVWKIINIYWNRLVQASWIHSIPSYWVFGFKIILTWVIFIHFCPLISNYTCILCGIRSLIREINPGPKPWLMPYWILEGTWNLLMSAKMFIYTLDKQAVKLWHPSNTYTVKYQYKNIIIYIYMINNHDFKTFYSSLVSYNILARITNFENHNKPAIT